MKFCNEITSPKVRTIKNTYTRWVGPDKCDDVDRMCCINFCLWCTMVLILVVVLCLTPTEVLSDWALKADDSFPTSLTSVSKFVWGAICLPFVTIFVQYSGSACWMWIIMYPGRSPCPQQHNVNSHKCLRILIFCIVHALSLFIKIHLNILKLYTTCCFILQYLQHVLSHIEPSSGRQIQGNICYICSPCICLADDGSIWDKTCWRYCNIK